MNGKRTAARLRCDLEALGIQPGDSVLMHSSFRSLGGIEDGAEGFFRSFTDLLGSRGTLIVPTLTYDSAFETLTFDLQNTPGCVGWLSEYFRTRVDGVLRSIHPTHSCAALGYSAAFMTADHERDDTPCGGNSPFRKLPLVGGKILMLGCTLSPCTSMHGVEEVASVPYVFDNRPPVNFRIIGKDGSESRMAVRRHGFGVHGCAQRYDRINRVLFPPDLVSGKVLDADAWLIDAAALWRVCRLKMMDEPCFFVDVI
ncbi:MAG: AAC(3) family N-acetyltransferase [Eubacteriales bacterium]|nr:AAC(3) family N-acetyltransferase [Eubacteriales bacterium]